ncbi:unnamed protein product [Darwinula stevensoni]|uniref:Uncharacterized protein n=1 Tax=Darwinula stevensoni TaxID=69355 RepID=A0A7R9FUI1_9CRUS|nr:unnamed protein product [Darwinula stevensoni]CAG0908245.1 unnamed protein product [Darwinula stevensoni]
MSVRMRTFSVKKNCIACTRMMWTVGISYQDLQHKTTPYVDGNHNSVSRYHYFVDRYNNLIDGYYDLVDGYHDFVAGYHDLVDGYHDFVDGSHN